MKLTRKQLRGLIIEAAFGGMPYRAKAMLGLVPGESVLATDAIEDPFVYSELGDFQHRDLWFAIQDLTDAVMSGQENTTGQVQLRPEKLTEDWHLEYLMEKARIAKRILKSTGANEKWFIRDFDALTHFVREVERVLIRRSGGPDFSMV